jgi:predicted cupin superfamily sugar epimerase
MSSIDSALRSKVFAFPKFADINKESPKIQKLIQALGLQEHIEGGYFVETDKDERRVANPFLSSTTEVDGSQDTTRAASTSIFYLITPKTPIGHFHRNKGRTVHTLHEGRGRYVLIHPPKGIDAYGKEKRGGDWRIETFVVGRDVTKGERLQWIVGGGIWKASFLLGSGEGEICKEEGKKCADVDCTSCGGCLISEVCSSLELSPCNELSVANFVCNFRLWFLALSIPIMSSWRGRCWMVWLGVRLRGSWIGLLGKFRFLCVCESKNLLGVELFRSYICNT